MAIFDDGLDPEEMAFLLGLADELAEDERERLRLLNEEKDTPILEDDPPMWWEKD